MRIAMLSKAVVVGAYQRKLEELARLPGLDLSVIAPSSWRDSRGETRLERVYTAGYQLIESPIALDGHYHAHFYPRLGAILREIRPDLLHIDEEPYNLATWQAMRWAVRHEVPALFFTWQNLMRRYPPPFRWIERHCHRHAAWAIAGNLEASEVLRAKGFRQPIDVIPQFGVDPQIFEVAPIRPAGDSGLVAGYAGGLIAEKGLDLLLRAVASCTANPPWRAAIVGEGPEQAALQALANDLGIADRVAFRGKLPSTRMPEFYREIDLLVLPSRTMPNWKEQFGRVLIEAMACGVPVIGSDSGEIPHVIGEAGWTFPEEDAPSLADLLRRLAEQPDQRAELARRGRLRVLDHYTQQQIASATHQVYRQILEASN